MPTPSVLLLNDPWPGNVRQLRHVLPHRGGAGRRRPDHARAPAVAGGGFHRAARAAAAGGAAVGGAEPTPNGRPNCRSSSTRSRPTSAWCLLQLLEQHRWNVSNVAKALDVSRNTLYRKLHKLHIEVSHAA